MNVMFLFSKIFHNIKGSASPRFLPLTKVLATVLGIVRYNVILTAR